MNSKISVKFIKNYINENYGELRHDPKRLLKACKAVAKIYGYTPKQIFHFMIEDAPLDFTHSYGFHSSFGREIIDEFQIQYYEMRKKIKVDPF